jgi:polyhydroxyalkanoate synthesis regulator protein
VQTLVPRYLEQAMTSFARQQEQMRVAMQQTMGGFFPFGMEDLGRQNMAMMERAMSLFSPFTRAPDTADRHQPQPTSSEETAALRAEVEFLRSQLAHVRTAQHADPKSIAGHPPDAASGKRAGLDTSPD